MANQIDMALQMVGNVARIGWYAGLQQATGRMVANLDDAETPRPSFNSLKFLNFLQQDLRKLVLADARNVRKGIYPTSRGEDIFASEYITRLRSLFQDLPHANKRRQDRDGRAVKRESEFLDKVNSQAYPDYYLQNFHYQTGGYLTEESARLYDIQVETLFSGTGHLMRRQLLRPLAAHLNGRDQRKMRMLDVACGTGRFMGQVKGAFPALYTHGLDLSHAYLEEAQSYLRPWRRYAFTQGAGESLPFADASYDIVSCIYMFHELPGTIREQVVQEMARVLRPGGLMLFMDSLQTGDNARYDKMLSSFPDRFHEPYYASYLKEDLGQIFDKYQLRVIEEQPVFISKMMVCEKL